MVSVVYRLTEESRDKLLSLFPPKFSNFIGHEMTLITFKNKKSIKDPITFMPRSIMVVGYIIYENIESLIVMINGRLFNINNSIYNWKWSIDTSRLINIPNFELYLKENHEKEFIGNWNQIEQKSCRIEIIPEFRG